MLPSAILCGLLHGENAMLGPLLKELPNVLGVHALASAGNSRLAAAVRDATIELSADQPGAVVMLARTEDSSVP